MQTSTGSSTFASLLRIADPGADAGGREVLARAPRPVILRRTKEQVAPGTCTASGGTVTGEYDISRGSTGCSQGDLLLKDAFQPGSGNWRTEVQMTSVRYPYSSDYDLTYANGTFSVYASATDRLTFSAGWDIRNAPMPASQDSIYVYTQGGMPWQTVASANKKVAVWTPAQ